MCKRKEMVTWGCATSSFADLHFTQMALFWLSGHRPCACYWPRPPLTLLQMSLLSPSHIYMHRGVRTQTHGHTHTSACLQAPHSSVSASFCLPSACRLEDRGSEGGPRERRVARQNGWSHEHRSVYKPKAEQSRSKGRKGKANRRLSLSLSTIKDWKRKRGSLPWQSQLEVGETKHNTRRHTRAHTQPLSQFFFFSQLKEQMVRGRVGSPPPTHMHWLTHKHTLHQQNTKPSCRTVVDCMELSSLCLGFRGKHISAFCTEEEYPLQDQRTGGGDNRGEERGMRLVKILC